MSIEKIRALLENLNLPKSFIIDQTASCIIALSDITPRPGLIGGHKNLSQGARIHDILNYVRDTLGKQVAENTRETYRKHSLRPLMECGLVIRHQLSTNDPNTYYRLHPTLLQLLSSDDDEERKELMRQLRVPERTGKRRKRRRRELDRKIEVRISSNQTYVLSPGEHNILEKAIVEVFAYLYIPQPQVVYLGDTAPREGYQNRHLMRRLNLPIDITASLPDVILYSDKEHHLVLIEAVTHSGPVSSIRLTQLQQFTLPCSKLGNKISYVSTFPSRAIFRRFVEDIAWGSSVWIESEPNNIIHFEVLKD